jgi:hypothetical protein
VVTNGASNKLRFMNPWVKARVAMVRTFGSTSDTIEGGPVPWHLQCHDPGRRIPLMGRQVTTLRCGDFPIDGVSGAV